MDCVILKCTSCEQNFSEERVPRNLKCGHSLCTDCVSVILARRQPCPECHMQEFVAVETNIPINYPLLRVIRAQCSEEIDISKIKVPANSSVREPDSFPEREIWNCGAHGGPLLFLCSSCSAWACQDCLVLDHPFLPRGNCKIVGHADAMTRIRTENKKLANRTYKFIKSLKINFTVEKELHQFCLKRCTASESHHRRIIQRVESHMKDMKRDNRAVMVHSAEIVDQLSKTVNSTVSPEEMTKTCNRLSSYQEDLKRIKADEEGKISLVLDNVLQHFRLDLKMRAEDEKPVYAITGEEEGSMWAPIVVKDTRLMLYSLRKGKPPGDGYTIPLEYVRKLIPSNQITVFFEVGTAKESFGLVSVRLYGDSPIVQQIALLCSLEEGRSYKNTCFFKYDASRCVLTGGDYENNDGTGGKPIVQGTRASRTSVATRKLTGFFVSERATTKFHIHLHKTVYHIYNVVGRVTKGLENLEAVSNLKPLKKSLIRDCGLFIPMSVQSPAV